VRDCGVLGGEWGCAVDKVQGVEVAQQWTYRAEVAESGRIAAVLSFVGLGVISRAVGDMCGGGGSLRGGGGGGTWGGGYRAQGG
jgi:hypothetical protein